MSIPSRLTGVFYKSDEVPIDESSRIVFLSDCHRGDNSKADNFAPNRSICNAALDFYFNKNFTYIEIGDGDELWENDKFTTLFNAHKDTYMLMQKFYISNRLYMIYGNHDIYKHQKRFVQKNLYKYFNPATQSFEPLFDNIKIHEGLILRYRNSPYKIFVVHGHQGDILNDRLWPVARFLVRYVWRHIDLMRSTNPISPARNTTRMLSIENNISRWASSTNNMVIAGHTHHSFFPKPGQSLYFNDGSCVYDGYITCIEIQDGNIMLVKWRVEEEKDRIPVFKREIIAGPERILDFFA